MASKSPLMPRTQFSSRKILSILIINVRNLQVFKHFLQRKIQKYYKIIQIRKMEISHQEEIIMFTEA